MKVLANFAVATLAVGTVSAGWHYGYKGHKLDCPYGEIMTGMCGSGYRPRCNGNKAYYGIHCSTIGDKTNKLTDCTRRWSNYGDYATCPSDRPLAIGGCGSGSSGRCNGGDDFNGINCCKKDDINIKTNSCESIDGDYGEGVKCRPGYAVHKLCGSGRYRDCWDRLIYIRCCKIEEVAIKKIVYHYKQMTFTAAEPMVAAEITLDNNCNGLPPSLIKHCQPQEKRLVSTKQLTETETLTRTAGRAVAKGTNVGLKPDVFKSLGFSFGTSKTVTTNQGISIGDTISTQIKTDSWDMCRAGPFLSTTCKAITTESEAKLPFTITWTDGRTTQGVYEGVRYLQGRTVVENVSLLPNSKEGNMPAPYIGSRGICVNVKVDSTATYATAAGKSIDVFVKLEKSNKEYKLTVDGFNTKGYSYRACGHENISVASTEIEKVSVQGTGLNNDGLKVAGGDDGFFVEINGLRSRFFAVCDDNVRGWWIDTDGDATKEGPCATGKKCELAKF